MDEPDSCAGESSGLLAAVSVIFRALGRGVLCLDGNLRVLHASEGVDQRLSPEALARVAGMPVAEVLGDELFGPGGPLLRALEEGQRREGWGTTLRIPGEEPKPVSVTVAPIDSAAVPGCDPRVSYLVVVRPAEEGEAESGPATRLFSGLVARSAVMLRLFALIEQLRE
nr:PAS domain-containing protein [Thermoanaerobaculia bacterium]